MDNVEIIDYTGCGSGNPLYAAELLIFTKNTRLELSSGTLEDVRAMPERKKLEELDYMAATIPSSWEFVHLTFLLSGVSRACAQQITRTRTGSYAMQSQRVTDAGQAAVKNPYDYDARKPIHDFFDAAVEDAKEKYNALIDQGSSQGDARAIMPMGTECNLVASYNLRSFLDLVKARRSLRTQDEYRGLIEKMANSVLELWPWSGAFFRTGNEKAIELLESLAFQLELEVENGGMLKWKIAKAIDLIK